MRAKGNQASLPISLETEELGGRGAQSMDLAEKQMDAQGGAASGSPAVKASGGKKKPAGATTK